MRPPIYNVYRMKAKHLPNGVKSAWLRTWPGEAPNLDRWFLIGRERHLSKLTVHQMNRYGVCYSETANWTRDYCVRARGRDSHYLR